MNITIKKLGLSLPFLTFMMTALMACSQAPSTFQTTESLPDKLYVRGAFNGWSTNNELIKNDAGLYRSQVSVGLGIHAFKLASNDWSFQMLLDSEEVIDLENSAGESFQLAVKNVDFNSQILTPKPATFDLVFNPTAYPAQLTIENVEFIDPEMNAPHDNASLVTLEYLDVANHTQQASFSIQSTENALRTYVHSTSQTLRDPVPQHSIYSEDPNLPYVRSGNIAFDALFALAMDEMKLNAVANIKDGNYNLGKAIACDCFETGEKWNYVWTRDLAYAANLGLGFYDPQRVVNSLLFKTSALRTDKQISSDIPMTNNATQIMQDTGSGGSWPISTDRVTWAFGADSVLGNLSKEQRKTFIPQAFDALVNTLNVDRTAVFNPKYGLYQGEQSFLDWREQSYAQWIVDDLASMSTSFSLSTNVAHYQALELAARLAIELGEEALQAKYQLWASELKHAINEYFWLPERGLYSSLSSGHPFPVALEKYDWLGQSLAIITGIANTAKTQSILKNYPHSEMGPPVIFPQQPNIQIYHNRAIWPFVTAFGLQAAKRGNNAAVARNAIESLIRGAALNLSNMENLEWLSGQSIWLERDAPKFSGPAINSKRQLWSVAGYINMVSKGIFGIETEKGHFVVDPFIPTEIASRYFYQVEPNDGNTHRISLEQIRWLDKTINVQLLLPRELPEGQVLKATAAKINNVVVPINTLTEKGVMAAELKSHSVIELVLKAQHADIGITKVSGKPSNDNPAHFAPQEPKLALNIMGTKVELHISETVSTGETLSKKSGAQSLVYDIYRNGKLIKKNFSGSVYPENIASFPSACYSVASRFSTSLNASHHSQTKCTAKSIRSDIGSADIDSNVMAESSNFGLMLKNWGEPNDRFKFTLNQSGSDRVAIQIRYRNLNHSINTGITAGVKNITVKQGSTIVAKQVVQLPHTKPDGGVGLSTPVYVSLEQGQYVLDMTDLFNMSNLKTNATYSSAGGIDGSLNQFDIYGILVTPIEP